MGKDKKSKEVPVTVYVEAKKRYLEQLQQILTPRLYEGFESLYDDALELLENEFEEKRQQTKSILKTFQDALKEIPVWNQDIIEHEAERIIQVSNCDYLDDLIDALFKAESKILTSVQTINKSTKIKVKVPIASHFIHRCYISSAREIFKNPFVFNHFKDLTPRDKQNNLREAIFMINEGITNAVRELLPIRDILKNSIHNADLSGTESDYSSDNSSNSDSDESSRKKHKKKHKRHESSSESSKSESSESEMSDSGSEIEEENHKEEISLQENFIEVEEKNNKQQEHENVQQELVEQKYEDSDKEEDSDEEEDSDDENEDSDEENEDELEKQEDEENNIEEEKEIKHSDVDEENKNSGVSGFFNSLFSGNEEEEEEEEKKESINLDDIDNIFERKEEMVEVESVAKPSEEIKKIVFEGNKIPKEYRINEEEDVEQINVNIKEEFVDNNNINDDNSSIASSGIIYRSEKPESFVDLSDLRINEKKKIKKESTKFVKPLPPQKVKTREESLNKLIQKQREFYKNHLNPQDNLSVLSGASSLNSKASLISNESRTKLIDNYLNRGSNEGKKSISYLSSVMNNKIEEDDDSGEEYMSDPELNH